MSFKNMKIPQNLAHFLKGSLMLLNVPNHIKFLVPSHNHSPLGEKLIGT